MLVICEPLVIPQSFVESFKTTSITHKCKIVVDLNRFKLAGCLNLNLNHASMRLVKLSFLLLFWIGSPHSRKYRKQVSRLSFSLHADDHDVQ